MLRLSPFLMNMKGLPDLSLDAILAGAPFGERFAPRWRSNAI